MIWPPPKLMRWVPVQPEALHVARDRLVASMMEHDSNRLLETSKVLNRVVYDSIEAPPRLATSDASISASSISGDAVTDIAAGTLPVRHVEAHTAASTEQPPSGPFDSLAW